MFSNGLNTLASKRSGKDDIDRYADFSEHLSDLACINERIEERIDEVSFEDQGFLKTYEEFSFTASSQL